MSRVVAEPGRAHLEDLVHVEPDVIICQGLVQLLYDNKVIRLLMFGSFSKQTAHIHGTVTHHSHSPVGMCQWGLSGTKDIALDFNIPPSHTHTHVYRKTTSMPRKEGYINTVKKWFSSYLKVCVVNMFKDQGRCPGLRKKAITLRLCI